MIDIAHLRSLISEYDAEEWDAKTAHDILDEVEQLRSVMSQAKMLLMATYMKSSHADAAIALMNKALGTEVHQSSSD